MNANDRDSSGLGAEKGSWCALHLRNDWYEFWYTLGSPVGREGWLFLNLIILTIAQVPAGLDDSREGELSTPEPDSLLSFSSGPAETRVPIL